MKPFLDRNSYAQIIVAIPLFLFILPDLEFGLLPPNLNEALLFITGAITIFNIALLCRHPFNPGFTNDSQLFLIFNWTKLPTIDRAYLKRYVLRTIKTVFLLIPRPHPCDIPRLAHDLPPSPSQIDLSPAPLRGPPLPVR